MTKVKYLSYLSTAFSPQVLRELAENSYSNTLNKVLIETNFINFVDKNDTYNDVFDKIFKYLVASTPYIGQALCKNA